MNQTPRRARFYSSPLRDGLMINFPVAHAEHTGSSRFGKFFMSTLWPFGLLIMFLVIIRPGWPMYEPYMMAQLPNSSNPHHCLFHSWHDRWISHCAVSRYGVCFFFLSCDRPQPTNSNLSVSNPGRDWEGGRRERELGFFLPIAPKVVVVWN